MSKKEILIKWKTVETITPDFPDDVLCNAIKKATE